MSFFSASNDQSISFQFDFFICELIAALIKYFAYSTVSIFYVNYNDKDVFVWSLNAALRLAGKILMNKMKGHRWKSFFLSHLVSTLWKKNDFIAINSSILFFLHQKKKIDVVAALTERQSSVSFPKGCSNSKILIFAYTTYWVDQILIYWSMGLPRMVSHNFFAITTFMLFASILKMPTVALPIFISSKSSEAT